MKVFKDIAYANEHDRQVLDLYIPDKECFKTFIYIHGGGMESGSKDKYIKLGEYLASQGHAAIIINYRLYPDAKYPDFIEDSAAAVKWSFDHINEYGKSQGIYVGGSSAGGYITMMLCFHKKWLAAQGLEPLQISGFYHDAGQPTTHFNVLREKGIDTRRVIIDETAPLYYVGMDEKYPPMHFVVSDNDIPGRLEQIRLVKATLAHFGHDDGIEVQLEHGRHCQYVHDVDENKIPRTAKMISEYLNA